MKTTKAVEIKVSPNGRVTTNKVVYMKRENVQQEVKKTKKLAANW